MTCVYILKCSCVVSYVLFGSSQDMCACLGCSLVLLTSTVGFPCFHCPAGVTQHPLMHHSCFPILRPWSWMNPNFRIPGTILEPSAMQRLAWEQEPNPKMCPVHAPPFYGGVSVGCTCTIHVWWCIVGTGWLWPYYFG
jgi:hypothetical protein